MKTENIFKLLSILCLLNFLGCDNNLDVQPADFLTPESVLANGGNLQNILIAAYDLLGQDEVLAGQTQLASELLANSGELDWRGTFADPAEFNRKEMTAVNGFAAGFWDSAYEGINLTNIIFDNLELIEDSSERNRIEAEAKFIRGTLYFELARFFSLPYNNSGNNSQLGLPIVSEGVVSSAQLSFPSRNTLEETYDQAINDLSEAYAALPASNSIFADKYAAQAVLARLYLQQGNFPSARDAAHDVLENSGHSLASTYAGAFNNDSDGTEDIFMLQITTQDGINDFNTFWATRDFGGRSITGDVTVEAPFFEIFSGDDDRQDFTYEGVASIVTTKWQSQFANVPYLRIAEMHLIRAESNFREGSSLGLSPDAEITALRNRSNADPIIGLTLDDILEERKRELAFEGHALHDLKRLQGTVDGIPFNSDLLVFPIPQGELDSNPNLEPNPGYNN
ncbi:RagB/SusD family nutrient uptake outer membrane protein [Winogradskyella maritima]|uniref:RagB/SusD family nutrient uptake outer membrane protein n=1 Tax=Winogradskyella maritima TaxID=1517766 RepID=A0ABV8AK88_9FLAO|nr:RagB/SusD family nutrient uptake outer membrane protein [Winogradskyella maritima]